MKKEVKKRNEKEELIRNFIISHKDDYSKDVYEFLINSYMYYINYPTYAYDVLLQLFSKYEVLSKEEDVYYGIFEKINKYYGLNRNIVEVATGQYPRLSEIIDDYQNKIKKGTIKAYDPLLVVNKLGNIKLHKEMFCRETKVKEGSLIIASAPCDITLDLIEKANNEDLEFLIALCGCVNKKFNNYDNWVEYVFDVASYGAKNGSKVYRDELSDNYNYPYPIIYKKY